MKPVIKNSLHWAGSALAFIGIAFVLLRLREYDAQIDINNIAASIWMAVLGFSLIYGLANLLLARAWWHLLSWLGEKTSPLWAFKVYGISQLAKYLPGNIFHLAGRQALGMAAGVQAGALAKSIVWELSLIALSAVMFAALALPLVMGSLSIAVSAIVFIFITVFCAFLVRRYLGRQCIYSWFYYSGFLLISGMLFSILLHLVSGIDYVLWLPLSGAFVLAWLAGLLTPGAPAGIGVRELVLFFLLQGVVAEADLLMVIVLGRVVTIAGDMFFYLGAIVVCEKGSKEK